MAQARIVARKILTPFLRGGRSIYLVYNEFKSAMSQRVVPSRCCRCALRPRPKSDGRAEWKTHREFLFEPIRASCSSVWSALHRGHAAALVVRIDGVRARCAHDRDGFGDQNASEMISKLTLVYNRARQPRSRPS